MLFGFAIYLCFDGISMSSVAFLLIVTVVTIKKKNTGSFNFKMESSSAFVSPLATDW